MELEPIENSIIVGASSAEVSSEELPMIVQLRGDEPYAESFCRDADYVMKELGIKRSRLTQISGKDLRVGRIRVDRYTRPMYRDEDIEVYKSWTRSPATHKNSSQMIDNAVARLEQKSSEFAQGLKDVIADVESSVANDLKDYINTIVKLQEDRSYQAKIDRNVKWNEVFSLFSKNNEKIQTLSQTVADSLEENSESISSYGDVINFLHLEMKELRAENRQLHKDLEALVSAISGVNDSHSKLSETLLENHESILEELKEIKMKEPSSTFVAETRPVHKNRYMKKRLRKARL